MQDDLIDTLRDCADALGEVLPRDHAHRKLVDKINLLLYRHDWSLLARRSGSLPTDRRNEETGMSEALERVIAEQQKEIDRLRLMERNNIERWQHENKAVERIALAAFGVLSHPESPECHFELKRAVVAMGFCPRCEWRPCECEEGNDD